MLYDLEYVKTAPKAEKFINELHARMSVRETGQFLKFEILPYRNRFVVKVGNEFIKRVNRVI